MKKLTLGSLFVGAMMAMSSMSVTGCLTDDNKDTKDTTKDTTSKSELSMKTITLGAQKNTAASSLDLDTWTAYSATAGAAKSADIDVIFAYSTSAKLAALYSPNIAKNGVAGSSGGFDFMASWPNANTTLMRSIATVDTAKVKTQADIKALYDAGTDPSPVGRIEAKKDSYVVAKSNLGLYTLIKVTDVTAAEDGTASLSGWAKW
jgi:hypothetical protein